MNWLPKLFKSTTPTIVQEKNYEIQVQQTQALSVIADSLKNLSTFLSGEGATRLLGEYAKSQIVKDIFGGLAAHDGRNALDARFIKQNATDVIHAIEAVFDKARERGEAKTKGEVDPELHDAESDYLKWKDNNEH